MAVTIQREITHTAQREEAREAILDATDRLFERYGFRKTTIEDIAQEAGVSRGTVYLYFKNKEEIALSWLGRYNGRVRERMAEIAREPVPTTERIRKMLLARILTRRDNIQHLSVSMDELFANMRPLILEHRQKCQDCEAELLAAVLNEGKAAGVFAFDDAMTMARLLTLATASLLPYSLSVRQLGERAEMETRANGLVELLLEGLGIRD